MDDDPGPKRRQPTFRIFALLGIYLVTVTLALAFSISNAQTHDETGDSATAAPDASDLNETTEGSDASGQAEFRDASHGVEHKTILDYFPVPVIIALGVFITCSAFFSASEVAFFSLHRVRLRSMAMESRLTSRNVTKLMQHPSQLLITILIGNMIVNVLISVLLPAPLEQALEHFLHWTPVIAYTVTIISSTFFLVFFGEIMPKVVAVRVSEAFARTASIPMVLVDRILSPVRVSVLGFTELLFRVTRFDDIKAAPFITDEEFIAVLEDSEAHGVIEEEEGQMIQGILESGDAKLKEILVPRVDIVAIDQSATVGEALALFRAREFSRVPAYEGDLDNVTGVLVAKDLLKFVFRNQLDYPIKSILRPPNYVPQTMTVQSFVRDAQHKRMHLAIVADEFGGTAGIVTLEDAIEEVVGEIQDANDEEPVPMFERLSETEFSIDGGLHLDELQELTGLEVAEGSHQTVAGFFLEQSHEIANEGDRLVHNNIEFIVDAIEGKRILKFRVNLLKPTLQEDQS